MNHFEFSVPTGLLIATGVFVLFAAYSDFRTLKIPNTLTFLMLFSSVVYHFIFPKDLGIALSIAGVLTAFLLSGPFFFLGGLGAGDVKLFLGIGAWVGPQAVLLIFFVTSLLIGGISVYKIVGRDRTMDDKSAKRLSVLSFFPRMQSESIDDLRRKSPQRLIPVGVLIAIALLLLILWEVVRLKLQSLAN